MLQLSKNILSDIRERGIKKIKIFFYESGCSGNKLDISYGEFDISEGVLLDTRYDFLVYAEKPEGEKLAGAMITKTIKADHTGKEQVRYIFSSDKVLDRCGCGSSFGFEKKQPTIDLGQLANLKNKFKK